MIWYGVEPLVAVDRTRALSLAAHSSIPSVRRYVARRAIAAEPAAGLTAVVSLLKATDDRGCRDMLTGAREALRGASTLPSRRVGRRSSRTSYRVAMRI